MLAKGGTYRSETAAGRAMVVNIWTIVMTTKYMVIRHKTYTGTYVETAYMTDMADMEAMAVKT